MEKDEYFYTVREELKELRLLERDLNSLTKCIEKYECEHKISNEYAVPETFEKNESYENSNIAGPYDCCEEFRQIISRTLILKEKYYPLIATLDPLDRIIILDGYINKTPYKKLGKEIGYTKEGIQKRTYIIIGKIAGILKSIDRAKAYPGINDGYRQC